MIYLEAMKFVAVFKIVIEHAYIIERGITTFRQTRELETGLT